MNHKIYLCIALCCATNCSILAMSRKTTEIKIKLLTFEELFDKAETLQYAPAHADVLIKNIKDNSGLVISANKPKKQTLMHALLLPKVCIGNQKNTAPRSGPEKKSWRTATTLKCLTAFIELGAAINAVDSQGDTPLHCAAKQCAPLEIIEFLLRNSASITITNNAGNTPRDDFRANFFLTPLPENVLAEHGLACEILEKNKVETREGAEIEMLLRDPEKYLSSSSSSKDAGSSDSDGLPIVEVDDD